ncbi:unnamed protein product [Effrenium voratum]|nr:unnamed protein product [Effrenium voratum]
MLKALWPLLLQAEGNFMASLHTNYVVNLDFDSSLDWGEALEDTKVMSLAGGKRKFRCRLPGGKNQSRPDAPDAKGHFLAAKLVPWRSCVTTSIDFWTYELCSGSRVAPWSGQDSPGLGWGGAKLFLGFWG